MRLAKVIHQLLIVSALLGIILGPFSLVVADSAMASLKIVGMGGIANTIMSASDSCCQNEMPSSRDCQKTCPLPLLCTTAIIFQKITAVAWSHDSEWVPVISMWKPYLGMASFTPAPPVRPPRS